MMPAHPLHRRVWLLAGDGAAARAAAERMLAAIPADRQLWVGDAAPAGKTHIDAARAGTVLGGEFDALVFDAWSGLDPDALGATAGTVRGGGHLLLLAPPLSDWPGFADPDAERVLVAPWTMADLAGRFLRRAARLTAADPAVTTIDPERGEALPVLGVPPPLPPRTGPRTDDQRRAVAAIVGVVDGPPRRPLVLVSDRGRGKSSALGLAAAACMRRGPVTILVTAPRAAAAANVFARAAAGLGIDAAARSPLAAGGAELRFLAPDALLAAPGLGADLLLVDEAAAIPVPLLTALLARFPRIVFATTVHGYEGTGRGFAVRFRQVLERETPDWREMTLAEPVRWAAGDPMEAWVGRVLALDAEPAPAGALAGLDPAALAIERLDRDRLADDDALLDELFGLLVLAHYRTRPYDLRHLLDGPNVSVWVARHRGHVVACALGAREGGLAPGLAGAVFRGERRPRGHLIPQSLAAHLGLPEGAALVGERVLRIAVHPAVQGRGIGSRLIGQLLAAAREAGLDWFGTSFGATTGLLHFWGRAGLAPVRLGLSREAASGSHSALLLAALSPAGGQLLARARGHYARLLPRLLAGPLRDIDPVLAGVLRADTAEVTYAGDAAQERRLLEAVARAGFGIDDALGVLYPFLRRALADPQWAGRLGQAQRELLQARVLEGADWAEIVARLGLSGRGEAIAALRQALAVLLEGDAGTD